MWKNIILVFLSIAISLLSFKLILKSRDVNLLQELTLERGEYVISLRETIRDIEENFSIYQKQLPTLKVLQDAGIEINNIYDLRELIAEGDKLPYGSPFSGGHRITSHYGHRNELVLGGSPNGFHNGIDLLPKTRDRNIYATAEGEIIEFGYDEYMGKYILFETNTGYRLKYGHLKTIFWQDSAKKLVKGVRVQKGGKLGYMGSTGKWTTGPHLHFEIHKFINTEWRLLDPKEIINYIGNEGSLTDGWPE